jgi:hypothetical protein
MILKYFKFWLMNLEFAGGHLPNCKSIVVRLIYGQTDEIAQFSSVSGIPASDQPACGLTTALCTTGPLL